MKYCVLLMWLSMWCSYAQVGINTTNPQAQLDIQSTNQANPSNTDGLLIPKVDAFPSTNPGANQNGMLVFLTTTIGSNSPGFYYWNHPTAWVPIGNNNNSGWNLNGNAITAGQFIGTTNNQDLIFRRNGSNSGRVGTTHTSFGSSVNLSGSSTTSAFGATALQQNSGSGNSAFGYQAIRAVGNGSFNSALGLNTLRNNSSGSNNTALGNSSLDVNETGNFNTGIGSGSNVASSGLNNATVIGANAQVSASNSLVLGSINGVNGATADVNVGIGTTSPQEKLHVVGNIRMVDGNESAGRIMVSDANGTSTWTDNSTIASGTLDQAYDFGGAGNGNIITADSGAVLINGTDGLVSEGTLGSGIVAPSGSGIRMVWNPRKAAFRAGQVSGTQWDDGNIGNNSVAFQNGTASGSNSFAFAGIASSNQSIALGTGTLASGSQSIAFGTNTTASAFGATAFGQLNIASGGLSTAFGSSNSAVGSVSTTFGVNNTAQSFGETVFGIGATNYTPSVNGATQFRSANATDRLFVIGNAIDSNNNNGIDAAERSDAMIVLKNGLTRLPSTTNTMIDAADGKAVVTKEWVDTNAINTAWSLAGNTGTNPSTNFIGTNDNIDLVFRTNSSEKLRVTSDSRLLLNTQENIANSYLLGDPFVDLASESDENNIMIRSYHPTDNFIGLSFSKARGTLVSPGNIANGDSIAELSFAGYFGSQFSKSSSIYASIDGLTSATSMPGRLEFQTTPVGSNTSQTRMVIKQNGRVGVGTLLPTARLSIVDENQDSHVGNLSILTSTLAQDAGGKLVLGGAFQGSLLAPYGTVEGLNSDGAGLSCGYLRFLTNNCGNLTEKMRISHDGDVGIGTANANNKLHVFSGNSGGTPNSTSDIVIEDDTNVYQHFLSPNAYESGLLFGSDTASIHGGIIFDNSDEDLSFRTGGNTTRMTLASSGNLGLGTATPSRNIHVLGNSASTTNGQLYLEQSGTGDAIIHIGNTGARHYNLGLDTSTENFKIATHATTATSLTSSTLVTVQPTGEVGIGTITPSEKLHVSGPAGLTAIKITNTSLSGANSNVALDFQRGGNANTDWRIYNIGPNLTIANSGDELATINDLYQFQINRFMPMNDGVINLGQGANKWNTVFAQNGAINTSDVRQKKNIKNLSYGLDKLMQLRPVSFEWIKDDGSGMKLGLIAQELQQVIPEVVRDWDWEEDEQGNRKKVASSVLGVYYSDLIPVLIKATQDQQNIIEQQNKKIESQKNEIELLKQQFQKQYTDVLEKIKKLEESK